MTQESKLEKSYRAALRGQLKAQLFLLNKRKGIYGIPLKKHGTPGVIGPS
jgi:hypothetical protein